MREREPPDRVAPPLTSVDLGLPAVGLLAAQRLLEAIAGNPHAGREQVPCHLVVRASTDDVPAPPGRPH